MSVGLDIDLDANVTEAIIDEALEDIRSRIEQHGYNEVLLPPSEHQFAVRKLGINWKGSLILSNGKFSGLQSIKRAGDTAVSFKESPYRGQFMEVTLTLSLTLTNPSTKEDFKLLFLNREKEGVVTGTISDVIFTVVLGLNLLTGRIRVLHLKIKEVGTIQPKVSGLGWIFDYTATKIAKITLNKNKLSMVAALEEQIQNLMSEVIEHTPWYAPSEVQEHFIKNNKSY